MNKKAFFIAGTDTDVGKTTVALALMHGAKQRGHSTLGIKPIAAGCEFIGGQWRNDDALALQKEATLKLQYEEVNPVALRRAIAPHIAAQQEDVAIQASTLILHCKDILTNPASFQLFEGAGGWYVPLNDTETFADIATGLAIPVILVVGIKLGCINHALLTVKAIEQSPVSLAGWVANNIDPHALVQRENIDTLRERISAPCLGVIPYTDYPTSSALSGYLTMDSLLI